MIFDKVQHVAIIVSDCEKSKEFYVNKLGLKIIYELERPEKQSRFVYLDAGNLIIELCCFPNPPKRLEWPEAAGLRHLAFEMDNFDAVIKRLNEMGLKTEHIRTDGRTGKRYTFFHDPDRLPLEISEK